MHEDKNVEQTEACSMSYLPDNQFMDKSLTAVVTCRLLLYKVYVCLIHL